MTKKIMIAEDDEDIRMAVKLLLEGDGREVHEAVDGVVLRLEKSNRARIHENIQLIENRLTYNLIDSLLTDELHKKSITAKFQFGVFSTEREIFVLMTKTSSSNKILDKGYAFQLFPDEIEPGRIETDYLMLYFPNERGFLIGQMAGLLVISVSLLLIIIFSLSVSS